MFTILSVVISVLAVFAYTRWLHRRFYAYSVEHRAYHFNQSVDWAVRFLYEYYGLQFVMYAGMIIVFAVYSYESGYGWYALLVPPITLVLLSYWFFRISRYLDLPPEAD